MKDENFYNVTGWMINRLHLSGSNLICYAVIYGMTQDNDTWFSGSLKYLQGWMSASLPTVLKALKYLADNKYIIKREIMKNNVRLCQYKNNIDIEGTKESLEGVVKFLNQGTKESLEGGSKETLDNNKYKDNKYNNKEITKESDSDLFLEFWNTYNKKVGRVPAIRAWKKLTADDKRKAIEGIKPYQESMHFDKHYIKHPATYLNQRTWEDDFTDYNSKSFYEIREDDTDKEKRFKEHMRKKHPAIEQVRCPLSMCAYIDLANVYGSESVEQELTKIENNIALYKLSDISYEIAKSLEKGRI